MLWDNSVAAVKILMASLEDACRYANCYEKMIDHYAWLS